MATEIFIEPELEILEQTEAAEEWYGLCVELGLEKQAKLAEKSDEMKAPPYMFVDPKTSKIIRTLCPRLVNYRDYDVSTIPLDVLQEIQKCEKNGWYQKIQIAYDDKSPDPFVIGVLPSEHSWNAARHLIARWGAELVPFEVLEAKAIARLKDEAMQSLAQLKFEVEYGLANIESFLRGMLADKNAPKSDFTINSVHTW
jgi:hypothetical protein